MTRNQKNRGIGIIDVRAKPGHKTRGLLAAGNLVLECALGKGRISAFKREGDGATPLSSMHRGLYSNEARRYGAPLAAFEQSNGYSRIALTNAR